MIDHSIVFNFVVNNVSIDYEITTLSEEVSEFVDVAPSACVSVFVILLFFYLTD